MQNKNQIKQLLASIGASPKKRLGQNFLIDLNLMRLLVDSANIKKTDIVLEAGCGTGSLTEEIAEIAAFCIAVEFDRKLAETAKHQLAKKENVEIINADILAKKSAINPVIIDKILAAKSRSPGRLLLVANLPYSVASPLMCNLITGPVTADAMVVTVQKEVAQRMTALPATEHYGSLSILMNATGRTKKIRLLKPTVFWPSPKVDSAMISFVREADKVGRIKNMRIFSDCINLFMQHRRKQLKGCVKFAKGELANIKNWP
ncbi:MAG: 16S rRNA (adenine(1518)-N(6)/adenine(1519)-N(6))-dimethyltransferase RsmA, partial [Planctomycetota bacterium]